MCSRAWEPQLLGSSAATAEAVLPRARALQEKPRQREAQAQQKGAPTLCNERKPTQQ